MRIVLVTGLSGSGKSVAIRLLEDIGYYCVDNLPLQFLADVTRHLEETGHLDLALSVDARSEASLTDLPVVVERLRVGGHDVKVLFLTSSDAALIKRYSESRRRHPLSLRATQRQDELESTLAESIHKERELLAPLDGLGHTIDTSDLHPNTLRAWVREFVDAPRANLTLAFESFAFKDGIPSSADLVFDVRNLPNPFYDRALRPLTGLDAPVAAFLQAVPKVASMTDDIASFIGRWLPDYVADNRHYVTVAVGCTGGQHRSPYVIERLAERFRASEHVLVRHRAIVRPHTTLNTAPPLPP
jgi:RNase adapter protein RapZ